ncbi:MAG: hypothetical protein ACJ8LG_07395 [Massilia sp.]
MTTRREVLISGMLAPLLGACSGGGSDEVPGRLPQLPDQGNYGTRIADWRQLQQAGGDAVLLTMEKPLAVAGPNGPLRLAQGPAGAFGQQDQVAGGQTFMPKGAADGLTVGLWARNPGTRTLNFTLRLLNAAGTHGVYWNCAVDPGKDWIFLTLSPTQQVSNGWVAAEDGIAAVRIAQQDDMAEGAWQAGEYLLFGNVYADVGARPLFLITFDDGVATQRYPGSKPLISDRAYVTSSRANVFATNARHLLIVGAPIAFNDAAPTGLSVGTTYWIQTVPDPTSFTLASDAALTSTVTSDGFTGAAMYRYAGTALRSGQQIVESYGFKGNLFLVPSWLGTRGVYGYGKGPNAFMSADDARAMSAEGWSIGSHSNTHPASRDGAGLRLLGPYGYFLSNPVDNLPVEYVSAWRVDASSRRRAVAADPGTNIVTFENPHNFLVNMPIVFTDPAPGGLVPGVRYFCQSTPDLSSATFATDQGTLNDTALISSAWRGLADYRHAGAVNDDSAIFQDIMDGIAGLAALGLPTGTRFFALPQGSADTYVRSACIRAKLQWIRGASSHAHTIPVGRPSGGGLSGIANTPGGWLAQPDCIQSDAVKPSIIEIRTYIDATIAQGACGCSYHHDVGRPTLPNLDNLCAYLRSKADAQLIDVVTLDQMAARLK